MLHLVDINSFECMKMHGLTNPKITKYPQIGTLLVRSRNYNKKISTTLVNIGAFINTLRTGDADLRF